MPGMIGQYLVWHTSSSSAGSECVEVARAGDRVLIRDSKDPWGPVLAVTPDEWAALLTSVKAGALDLPSPEPRAGSGLR